MARAMGAPLPRVTAPVYPGLDALDPTARRFIVVGDTQETAWIESFVMERNHHLRPALLAEIIRRRPGAVLHLGDLVTWGSSRRHWARLDDELQLLRTAGIPLLPAVGNHDRFIFAGPAMAQLEARFPVLRVRTWYAFRHAGVLFVALDSNFGKLTRRARMEQEVWLDATLSDADSAADIRAVIAYWHHPPWTNSRIVRPSPEARERFMRRLAASPKAVAILCGHCHAYEHFRDAGLELIVSGGGGGPRQPLETRAARVRREDLFAGGKKRFMHFCELTLADDRATLDVVRMRDDRTFEVAATVPLRYRAG